MQPKKNEKVDLTKNSSLYFVIGLSVVLLVTWQTIEWKTYKKTYDYEALNVEDDDDEDTTRYASRQCLIRIPTTTLAATNLLVMMLATMSKRDEDDTGAA